MGRCVRCDRDAGFGVSICAVCAEAEEKTRQRNLRLNDVAEDRSRSLESEAATLVGDPGPHPGSNYVLLTIVAPPFCAALAWIGLLALEAMFGWTASDDLKLLAVGGGLLGGAILALSERSSAIRRWETKRAAWLQLGGRASAPTAPPIAPVHPIDAAEHLDS